MTMQLCPTKYFDCYVWSLSGKYITGGRCRHNSLGLKMKNAGNDPSMQYFPEESELKSVYNSRKCGVLSGSY